MENKIEAWHNGKPSSHWFVFAAAAGLCILAVVGYFVIRGMSLKYYRTASFCLDLTKSGPLGNLAFAANAECTNILASGNPWYLDVYVALGGQLVDKTTRSTIANEAVAIGVLREYFLALDSYSLSNPGVGFPKSLDALDSRSEIGKQITSPPYERSGYHFVYSPGSNKPPIREFSIVARPIAFGVTGPRSFFVDQSGVIRFTSDNRDPTSADDPLR